MKYPYPRILAYSIALLVSWPVNLHGQARQSIAEAVIGEPNAVTPEISTAELRRILADGKIPVLDVRSPRGIRDCAYTRRHQSLREGSG